MLDRSLLRNFDLLLLLAVVALCAIGIAMVYSATITTIDLADYWERQLFFLVMGLVVLVLVAFFDYRHLELLAQPAYLGLIVSLVAVYLFGAVQGGSQSWISIGGTLVQPTEAGKFLLIIFFAWYLSRFQEQMRRIGYLIAALFFLIIPLVLIYLQPDLGMAVNFAFIGGILILVSGIRLWHIALMGMGGLAALPILVGTMQGYMVERLQMFVDPGGNRDASFNVVQALISIGNGGWLGKGWGHGSQNQLHFLRVRHTDFIFSVIAEELGFVGTVLILLLLFFIIWRLVRIADLAQDQFGRLLTMGVAAIIFFQTLINVGMNLSIMPVTGVTLPFLSYGGSSLLSMLLAIGLAQSVVMRHRKMDFQ
ncbi:MAG: rod shape-determining protein RodA [Caldilineaceae bacterium]|nr:rod shape-determining protein RodA [Caldilineaceae bacterium]HRJ40580.1 FtsW/RodA/SpoVE family cell cycle protein [Caldilineaceae bacterium]